MSKTKLKDYQIKSVKEIKAFYDLNISARNCRVALINFGKAFGRIGKRNKIKIKIKIKNENENITFKNMNIVYDDANTKVDEFKTKLKRNNY